VITVKAQISNQSDQPSVVSVDIPDLAEVRAFANHIHATGKHWQGELFGWQAEYAPEKRKKPRALADAVYARRLLDRRERHLVLLAHVGTRTA